MLSLPIIPFQLAIRATIVIGLVVIASPFICRRPVQRGVVLTTLLDHIDRSHCWITMYGSPSLQRTSSLSSMSFSQASPPSLLTCPNLQPPRGGSLAIFYSSITGG
jgi:hypothetical protein